MPDPLPPAEVERCARSAWAYEAAGRNFLELKRPQVTEMDVLMDALQDEPDAFWLLSLFRRYHGNRSSFAIAPTAMSAAGSPRWHYSRIGRARDVLLERGLLIEVSKPNGRGRRAGTYRLREIAGSVNNHYTPCSPSPWRGGAAWA